MATALADPDTSYPGLPDGTAYDVAAVVAGLPALVEHLRSGGCPAPAHPEAVRSVLSGVEDAVWLVGGWTDAEREAVFAAVERVEASLPHRTARSAQ